MLQRVESGASDDLPTLCLIIAGEERVPPGLGLSENRSIHLRTHSCDLPEDLGEGNRLLMSRHRLHLFELHVLNRDTIHFLGCLSSTLSRGSSSTDSNRTASPACTDAQRRGSTPWHVHRKPVRGSKTARARTIASCLCPRYSRLRTTDRA